MRIKAAFKTTLLSIGLTVLFCACSSPKAPDFQKIENVKAIPQGNGVFKLTANAIYNNSNNMGATLSHLNLKIMMDGVELGKLDQDKQVNIPAKSDFSIPITLQIDLKKMKKEKGFLKKSLQKLLNDKLEVSYQGTMTFNVLNVDIPVPVNYNEAVSFGMNWN